MMTKTMFLAGTAVALTSLAVPAFAQDVDSRRYGWFSGDWELTVGVSGYAAPEYEGSGDLEFRAVPLIRLGRPGPEARFSSRNDNISIALLDNNAYRIGAVGKIVFGRDEDDSDDLAGLGDVDWGVELGGFAEVYPLDWLRLRGEVRHGVSAHEGVVADFAADAFADISDTVRVSAGPRLSIASADYFRTYYGVTPEQSAASGLAVYEPDGGLRGAGFGGAVTWKATDRVTASTFAEYARLLGPAEDSSLVQERGSPNQFTFGLSTTYRFDFTVP